MEDTNGQLFEQENAENMPTQEVENNVTPTAEGEGEEYIPEQQEADGEVTEPKGQVDDTEQVGDGDCEEQLKQALYDTLGEEVESGDVVEVVKEKLADLKEYIDSDAQIDKAVQDNPELYAVIQDISEGKSLGEALARNIDMDMLYPEEGDADFEAIQSANNDRKARTNEAKAYKATIEANKEQSMEVVSKYFDEHGMTPEQADEFANYIDTLCTDYIDGKITPEFLQVFANARNHDTDVANAEEAGAIKAKNARLDAQRIKKPELTDGLPAQGSAIAPQSEGNGDDMGEVFGNMPTRRNWR